MIPCPRCGSAGHRVIESRYQQKAAAKRRRCECKACGHRFNTQEQLYTGRLPPGPEPKPAAPPSQEAIWLARLDRLEASLAELRVQLRKAASTAQPVALPSGHPPATPTASIPIEELVLPARAYNGLKRAGVHTLGHLLELTPDDLLDIRQFGTTSLDDVVRALARRGQELRGASP